MKTKIWYSIQNGGDGSAYPEFMESEEMCKIDQEFLDEGWAESCCGCLIVESETPIIIKKMTTLDEAIKEVQDELNEDYMLEYKKQGLYPEWFKRLEGKLAKLQALKSNTN